MNRYCVIGRSGFLGSAIAKRLGDVSPLPTMDTRVLFYFGGHVHPIFELNPEFEMTRTLADFQVMLAECRKRGTLFVYTSSALVYERDTQFSMFKKSLEQIAMCSGVKTLGLRIFPVYGPGEDRTVISQWCAGMANGDRPIVFGDGSQSRDFIFIDDVVDQVITLVNEPCWKSRIVDIGTGVRTSFNQIVETINLELGTTLEPRYVQRPSSYSEGIFCQDPPPHKVSVEEGIRRILFRGSPTIDGVPVRLGAVHA